jgi:Fic family protein
MTYIHELAEWPEFTWDNQALAKALAAVRHKQGKHLGKMEALGFDLRTEASLTALTNEVVKSSAIEGKDLDTDEVRSSIARRLGLDVAGLPKPGREVEGIVEMMLDATRNFEDTLTAERLYGWHAALFPTGRSGMYRITVGAWRKDQSSDIDPVLKAAVAHLWFVTIHPFDDGNGRIARAIADMALSRADGSKDRFYSMSSGIEAERKEYYIQLESAQRGSLDITSWLAWFFGCLDRAIDASDTMLGSVLHKARLWQWINTKPVNERQRKIINRMLEHGWQGHLNTSKYAKLAKCSPDTALRDIKELLERDILIKNEGGGRSTSYRLADLDEV